MAVTTGGMLGAAAVHSATSGGTSSGGSQNSASSFSRVYGTEANQVAAANATSANRVANDAWKQAAEFNAEQAKIQRDWQEKMANTVYQRTVKDMIAAGINPVLAANMGLGTASVSSGAAASVGNPMSYMANTFADSQSASQSQGSSWNEASNGLAYLADIIGNAINGMTSGANISIALDGLKDLIDDETHKDHDQDGQINFNDTYSGVIGLVDKFMNLGGKAKDLFNTKDSERYKAIKENVPKSYSGISNPGNYQYHNNGL